MNKTTPVDECAHLAEHSGECLFADRDWSEACKPQRCVGCPGAVTVIVAYATRAERIEAAMHKLTRPVPSTKGMGPKDRADRLHAEMERRIALAKEALAYVPGERAYG